MIKNWFAKVVFYLNVIYSFLLDQKRTKKIKTGKLSECTAAKSLKVEKG